MTNNCRFEEVSVNDVLVEEPLGLHFAEEPREVPKEMMVTTSQWISNPNSKEWDYDQD